MINKDSIKTESGSVYLELTNEAGDELVISLLRNMMGLLGEEIGNISDRAENVGLNVGMIQDLQEHLEMLGALEKVIKFYGGTPYYAWG